MNARALLVLLPLGLVSMAACSSAPVETPDQEENVENTSEALNNGHVASPRIPGTVGGTLDPGTIGPTDYGPYGTVPAFPWRGAQYCPAVDVGCEMYSTVDWHDAGQDAVNAELASYGCAPARQWFSGYSAGWLGGIIAYCTDTAALRHHYSQFNFTAMDGACDACIPKAQPGKVWIMLEAFVGPNCPNGCRVRNEGGW